MRRGDLMLALLGSVALHAGLVGTLPSRGTEMAGGAEQAAVSLGTAFEDMAAGTSTATATPTDQALQAVTEKRPAPRTSPAKANMALRPTDAPVVQTHEASKVRAAHTSEMAQAITPSRRAVVTTSTRTEPLQARQTTPAPKPRETERASRPKQVITGRDIAARPVTESVRPVLRPAPSTRGNATRQARKGSTSRSISATRATGADRTAAARQAGNAAADNYPGRVLRAIRRVPQARVRGSGQVILAFTVTGQGQLAGVSVQRSSGNAGIDRAALAHLRRAAPFPKPPPGARQRFSVPITYR